uniref:Uncharacterized protein n=1 Tax=Anguilla anguilla TaxID=7936 RepID=A0A0E9UDQ7_ANGAN
MLAPVFQSRKLICYYQLLCLWIVHYLPTVLAAMMACITVPDITCY